ncbi:hypothetical protein [Flavobacterium bizetiae]|uniref:hypothetical protein n=1 Tax=Flavobacterium bizetiae TaxID=2704140 RepID=UPI0037572EF0
MIKNTILGFVIILTLGMFLIPFWLYADNKEALNIATNLISIISSLITVVIAFLLFDKFGVSKKALDKNIEVVFKLLEVIKSKTIFTEYESDSGTHHSVISIGDSSHESKDNDLIKNKIIVFNYDDINKGLNEINQFANNVWLPSQIKNKVQKISLRSASSVKDTISHKDKYVKIYFDLYPEARKDIKVMWFKTNQKETTFEEFRVSLEDLVFEIKTWLNKHSKHKLDLNI